MSFTCVQRHEHETEAERADCDARYFDAMSLIKMAQVNFAGPRKIARIHAQGRAEKRGKLEVVVFAEEEIVPWKLEDDQVDTDPGLHVPGLEEEDDEVPTRDDAAGLGPDEEITDPRAVPPPPKKD